MGGVTFAGDVSGKSKKWSRESLKKANANFPSAVPAAERK
jgi:hypothetical protein